MRRHGVLSLSSTPPGGVELHSFVRQRRSGDVAAQRVQPLAVVCINPHGRVQGEAGHKARKGLVPAERQPAIQAGWLKPSMSAQSICLKPFSLGMAS